LKTYQEGIACKCTGELRAPSGHASLPSPGLQSVTKEEKFSKTRNRKVLHPKHGTTGTKKSKFKIQKVE
jgi:hypothetical protein